MATEEAAYSVVLKLDELEVRAYESHIVAETIVRGGFGEAGSEAFGRLFAYISGKNTSRVKLEMTSPVTQGDAGEKIAMTAPVGQKRENGQWAVSFMMPASYTLDELPEPNDVKVILREIPARHMASIRYSGFWSEKAYLRNLDKLTAWIEQRDFKPLGEPVWARYNPPFVPWFLRRNEILVPIAPPV